MAATIDTLEKPMLLARDISASLLTLSEGARFVGRDTRVAARGELGKFVALDMPPGISRGRLERRFENT